jgi:DNA replication protein DnaC
LSIECSSGIPWNHHPDWCGIYNFKVLKDEENIMSSNEISSPEKTRENVLKPNRPVDLRSEDLFNTKIKADAIKDFIKNHPNTIVENRMFVLYGEWGSGKTTIIDYLDNELKSDFKTIYFEAWKFEKDGNLPLSLLEMICDKNINDSLKEALKSAYRRIGDVG